MPWPADFSDDAELDISGNPVRNDLVARLDKIYDVLKAIRNTLGPMPQGTEPTVAARFDAMNTALNEGLEAAATTLTIAFSEHGDDANPHPFYGKIITPLNPDGDGTLFSGGSPAADGPDYGVWVDTFG